MPRYSAKYVSIFNDTLSRTSMPAETIVIDEFFDIEPKPGVAPVTVTDNDTLTEAPSGDVILNFASGWTPGGGVKKGTTAQEENICQRSSLYYSLESEAAKPFYRKNHMYPNISSDVMLLTKGVQVIKDSKFNLLTEPFTTDVLSVAAPRLTDGMPCDEKTLNLYLQRRVYAIVRTLVHYGYRRPILGAWGCGAYKNDPTVVATLFKKALDKYAGYFDKVYFAIPIGKNATNHTVFSKILLG